MSGAVPIGHLRAVLRLISPEHITPMGKRMIEQVIEKYEQVDERQLDAAPIDRVDPPPAVGS